VVSFGYFIMKVILFLTLTILLREYPAPPSGLESFMFAVAIAVGVTPELLPMIMSITMARGSIRMSKKGVIVKEALRDPELREHERTLHGQDGDAHGRQHPRERTVDADGKPSTGFSSMPI